MCLPASGIPAQVPQPRPVPSSSHGLATGLPNHRMGALDHVRRRQCASGLLRQSGPGRLGISPGPSSIEPETPGASFPRRRAGFRRSLPAVSASSSSRARRSAWRQPACSFPGRRSEMFLPRSPAAPDGGCLPRRSAWTAALGALAPSSTNRRRTEGSSPRSMKLSSNACTVAGLPALPSTTPGGCFLPPASTPMAGAVRRSVAGCMPPARMTGRPASGMSDDIHSRSLSPAGASMPPGDRRA